MAPGHTQGKHQLCKNNITNPPLSAGLLFVVISPFNNTYISIYEAFIFPFSVSDINAIAVGATNPKTNAIWQQLDGGNR